MTLLPTKTKRKKEMKKEQTWHTIVEINNAYQNYDETTRTKIKTGYEVICCGWVAVALTCVSMSY